MQGGSFPVDAPVVSLRTRVLVNGVERGFESLSWEAEIPGDLPEGVAASTGIKERTGRVVWADAPVAERSAGPWSRSGGWPPSRGDAVEVWDDCDGQSWRRFYGRIDSNSGGIGEPLSSTLVDGWDEFDREAYVEPMLQSMPGVTTGEGTAAPGYLSSLTAWGPVYRAVEAAGKGWFPPAGAARLAASFQGGAVPWVGGVSARPGSLLFSNHYPGVQYHSDITIREFWDSRPATSLSSIGVLLRFPQQDVFASAASARAIVNLGAGSGIELRCTASTVSLLRDGTSVAQIPATYGEDDMCSVAVRWVAGTVTFHVNGVESVVASSATFPPQQQVLAVRCVNLAGVQVLAQVSASDWLARVRRVIRRPIESRVSAWGFLVLPASRMIVSRSARSVLEEFSAATLHSVWLDEDGILQVWGADRLIRAGIAREFTTTHSVLSLAWEESWDQMRHAARVRHLEPSISISPNWSIVVWQPSSTKQLNAGETDETFVEPGADEDWVEPDFTLESAASNLSALNWGGGSLRGATIVGQDTEAWGDGWVTVTLNHVKGYVKKLRQQVWSTLPASRAIQFGTPSAAVGVLPRWQGAPLPIIRARGLVQWVEMFVRTSAGPSWASEYTHDLKHWGSGVAAQTLADWLAPQLSAPTVTLRDLDLAYDPRIQIADMIRVTSDREGFTITGLVVGIRVSVDSDGHSMALTVRVTQVESNGATYGQLEAAYAGVGETYQTLESDWADTDYAAFESNPTGRQ